MDAKKSNKADLKTKRLVFLEIGMVVSMSLVLAAFQWTTEEKQLAYHLSDQLEFDFEEEWLPVKTKREPELEPPKVQTVSVITIVEDDEDIADVDIMDSEGDMDIAVEIIALEEEMPDESEQEIFYTVEEMPLYPGGDKALMKDIMGRVVYPEVAKENGIQGRVFVQFVVNPKGLVDKVQIIRGVDPSLDKEASRVIKTLTGWTPGMQRGKAVNVSFTVPINFQLN